MMKRKHLLSTLMAAVALVLLGTACNPGASSAGSGEKVQLEFKPTVGQVYKQVTKTDQVIDQKVMGMSSKTAQVTEMYLKNEVLSVDANGLADIRCTYERIKVSLDNSMTGKMEFDSDKDKGEVGMQYMGYQGLVGKSIGFKTDKRGTVQEVYGVEALFDSVISKAAGTAGGEMESVKKSLKSIMGDDAMKSMMQSASIQFPDVLIAAGDTWGKKISSMGAMPLAMDVTYKVDEIDGEKVILSFEGSITTDKDKALDLGMMEMSMDLTGDYSGTSELDRKTGMVIKTTMKQEMEGSMGTMGMTIPMKIDQTVTVEAY